MTAPTPPGGTGPTSSPPAEPTAHQYLQDLHFGQGLSYADIARRLGRSPRLLGFVARGQKPGRNLTPALRELSVTGAVTAEPARRVAASGQRARVRSRTGPVVPPPPRGTVPSTTSSAPPAGGRRPNQPPQTLTGSSARSAQQPDFTIREPEARNTFRQVSDVNETTQRGNHSLQAPKARWSYNRWAANNAFAKIASDAAQLGLRLHAAVHVEVGTGANRRRLPPVKLGGNGGYAAANVAAALQAEGGDAFAWLAGQIEGRYPEFEAEQWTVISVDVDVW